MSFYNVANPVNFTNTDANAKRIAPLSALTTVPASQYLDAAATLSVSQALAGYIVYNGGNASVTLPTPAHLLAGLKNSAITHQNSVGLNDMIVLHVRSNAGICTIQGVDNDGNNTSNQAVASGVFLDVVLRFTDVTAGQEAYEVL
jgi:hypothetical protein